MIRVDKQLGNGLWQGAVICQGCAVAAPIELWQVEPALNYAMPTGWTRVLVKGNLYSHLCPDCATARRFENSKETTLT